MLAGHALGVVAVASMRDGTRAFNGLPAFGFCTKRVVGFVIVIPAVRLSIEYVKRFVRERFLNRGV